MNHSSNKHHIMPMRKVASLPGIIACQLNPWLGGYNRYGIRFPTYTPCPGCGHVHYSNHVFRHGPESRSPAPLRWWEDSVSKRFPRSVEKMAAGKLLRSWCSWSRSYSEVFVAYQASFVRGPMNFAQVTHDSSRCMVHFISILDMKYNILDIISFKPRTS